MRVALFNLSKASRLLIIIHHLAVDGVSWRILMEDIQTAYQQISGGRQVGLPSKTTSFKRWAERLNEYAQQQESALELPYWLNMPTLSPTLPVDFERGSNTVGSVQSVVSVLHEEETLVLLHEVPAVFRTQINDALLTALLLTLQEWTANKWVLLDLEGHGREDLFPEVDVSRTVGWFTSIYPVWLEYEKNVSAAETLKSVKEQLRAIPNRGIGYGVLRYLNSDPQVKAALSSLTQAEISFNYMGQIGDKQHHGDESMQVNESSGPWYSLRGERKYKLEINCAIERNRLSVVWAFSENLHQRKTIELLAKHYLDALRSIVAHCQTPTSMEYTPSDFSESGLNQGELDRLMSTLGQLKDKDDE
jgi:non-ribosomal peptide synthase protein (TIGR01720 family)